MPKTQKGGMNRLSLLKSGRNIRKKSSTSSSGKKRRLSRKSPLQINSKHRYVMTITIKGVEKIEQTASGKRKKNKDLKYSVVEYVSSKKNKMISTEVKIDEKLNDILKELNKITNFKESESIYWDKINMRSHNPSISDIILKPALYRYLGTTMKFFSSEGELAELKIKKL